MTKLSQEVTFAELALAPSLLAALEHHGYHKPTPIQERVIPLLLEGKDVVGQAHTGTGKTLAFGLPALHMVKNDPKAQVLILSPVRELAHQIHEEIYKFSGQDGVKITLIHGGKSYARQIEGVKNGSQMVVATPGRLLDLLESKKLAQFKPAMIIIDEADEMLDKGFLDEIKAILNYFPAGRQTLLFSATMPEPIKHLAKTFLNDPSFIQIVNKEKTSQNVEQSYCLIEPHEREDALVRFLDTEAVKKTIVFCNTKKEVDHLFEVLLSKKFGALALHGDMEQGQRQKVMSAFRRSDEGVLVATEVAARGLNVEDVSHVFNYELPWGAESYVHRIGRTGRAGKSGKAISFVTPKEFFAFERICKTLSAPVQYQAVPTLGKAKYLKQKHFVDQLKTIEIQADLQPAIEQLKKEFSLEEALTRLLQYALKDQKVSGPENIGLDPKDSRKKEQRAPAGKKFRHGRAPAPGKFQRRRFGR